MINGKIIGIDARMIEMSGIGTYVQHLMGQGIYDIAVGKEEEIRRYDKNVDVIPCNAQIYGLKEQIFYPNHALSNVDLMHFPHYNVPLSYHRDFVVTVHDLTHIVLPEFLGNKVKFCYAKWLMKNALNNSKHVFTVSENSKKDIQKYFNISNDKISITYNAIDGDFRTKEKKEVQYLLSKYHIDNKKKIILYVGNLKPHKNLITLLEALRILNRNDIVLVLVGKAFQSVDLLDQEKQLGIADIIVHTGIVSKEELIDFYNLADLFVFPSLYEGFGIPPIEAMACGTPVIAANNSSIPEVVDDAAILFDGKDAKRLSEIIDATIENDKLKQELINKGQIRCNYFDWNKTREEVYSVLDKLTKS